MADLTPTVEADEGEGEATSKGKKELLEEAKERFKLAEEAWSDNRKAALEDTKFRNLEQWPEKIKAEREKAGRPCLTVDKGNQYVRQVVNDGRQNRPQIKIHPTDDDANDEAAEAFQDLIRSIWVRSRADAAWDTALDHAVTGGFGFVRIITKYVHEKTFNQDIAFKRVRNQQAVLLDPNIQEADGSDANWGFVIDEIPKTQFKKQWPKAKFADWENNKDKYSDGWSDEKNVRICEYFYKVETQVDLHLLADGSSVEDEEYQRAVKELGADKVPPIEETRSIPTCKVKWCRLSGAEVLEENDWLGKYIPIIPVFGNELDIDGKVVYSGLIRAGKDAMRLYNYMRSHFAENVALASKAPYIAAVGQVEDRPEWESLNNEPVSVALYNPIDVNGTALPPPRREPPPAIPEAYSKDMQLSEHDIQSAMGMFAASLGQPSNEKSGKAINARVRESDTGTFQYHDNLSRAIIFAGVQLVDLIPKVIDSRRAVQLMGEDGSSSIAQLDPEQPEAVRREGAKAIYNLGVGTYGVTVSTGPSYTTKRQEASEGMIALTQANPTMWQTHGDLIVKAQDWPNADEFAKRSKMALPPPIAQAVQAEEQASGSQSPEVAAVVAQATQAMQAKDQQIQAAEAGIHERDQALQQAQQENQALKSDREAALMKAQTDQFNAETARMKAAAEAQNPPAQPIDTSALEVAKLEYEDRWKKLEAETKVIVAEIGASAKAAAAPAMGPDGQPVPGANGANGAEQQPKQDTNEVLAIAVQGFSEAIAQLGAQLKQPKQVVRGPDGRVVGIH